MAGPQDKFEIEPQDASPESADEAVELVEETLDEEQVVEEAEDSEWEEEAAEEENVILDTDAGEETDEPADLVAAGDTATSEGHQGWTIMLICLGIGLIAACMIIPQADENRRMLYQTEKLKTDLAHLEQQVAINDEFIQRVGRDPALSERLAQRQLKFIRKGSAVLDLNEPRSTDSSPFSLTMIEGPPPMPEYEPVGGRLGAWCRDGRKRLYTIGAGLLLLATGLVLGATPAEREELAAGIDDEETEPSDTPANFPNA
jgi:hypothetical protein